MSHSYAPLKVLILMFAGWIGRHQLDVIEYLQEENRVLKERLGGRRLRFTDAERRRLARKVRALGRKVLNELETLVTSDTLLRWYRELVACKWNFSDRRGPGRPRLTKTIVDLILRMALENPSWGYTRIRGALANLGHEVGRGTIASILKEGGIELAPERGKHTRWSTFLKAHWECLTATDFLQALPLNGARDSAECSATIIAKPLDHRRRNSWTLRVSRDERLHPRHMAVLTLPRTREVPIIPP
ncbi:MAG: hypothetical protein ACREV7_22840 [Steroidobacteraceae bacterium]